MTLVDLTEIEFRRFYGREPPGPIFGWALRDGLLTLGVGGIVIDEYGERWAFVDALPSAPRSQWYRVAKRFLEKLRSLGVGTVKAAPGEFATADRFLRRLGFVPTGEMVDGREVYACQV